MTCYSYLRVSGKSQIEGDGPERQRLAIADFCRAHKLVKVAEFNESGVSGTTDAMDRPAFGAMMEAFDNRPGEVVAIVVERMDRLARDLMVSEMLLRACRERNIKVFSTDQGALIDMASDGGDPTRVLIRQIMAALAQWEKSNLVKKLRSARERAIRSGKSKNFNGFAYGMKDSAEAETLTLMLTLWDTFKHQNGKSNYARFAAVAAALNDGGRRTRRGTYFSTESVEDILRNYWKRKVE